GPLYRAFESGSGGGAASMQLPPKPRKDRYSPRGLELMPHQARLLEAVRGGHRTFLLADEPGLGKTAQSVLGASIAQAYPMLAVVPNVVKIKWAREVQRWTPQRTVTVINGDGDDVNAFADVFVINYAVLDRHLAWLADLGLRSMVVDEAHFIKNLSSQRSQHVLNLSRRIRERASGFRPLLMALTGTPLINDVEDFNAIWQFLGWTDGEQPGRELTGRLEATGLTPADRDFYPQARAAVIDMGIVRRTKTDVAADLPDKRIADLPVELDSEMGRSIRAAEKDLATRLVQRYYRMLAAGESHSQPTDGPDMDLLRRIARTEVESAAPNASGDNVFSMVRRIGAAKAPLAADYAAQLVHSVGKVVFFAKHVDVMDRVQESLQEEGSRTVSVRGDQSGKARQQAIDAFQNDPEVSVAICSLMAAGVGLNLHAASNVVLGELSWTAAEQQQAIDRVHRIGQESSVTAWRVLAAHTMDTKIAELIDAKKSLAARALDGSDEEIVDSETVQVEALLRLDELAGFSRCPARVPRHRSCRAGRLCRLTRHAGRRAVPAPTMDAMAAPLRPWSRAVLAGLLGCALFFAVGWVTAELFAPRSAPHLVLGAAVVDAAPPLLVDTAIDLFGAADKVVLAVVLAAVSAGVAVLIARVATGHPFLGELLVAGL